ncbi:hypothetical protein ElyMa_001201900 [Elysia marginata]|uniref:Uncharacterized protein n=1 Tax=Elysia marginata TaxID=1093978 RepID=A0AAV4I6G3_9GAST|nr:hypothetical protein ElyMa_001201900 [Elysia marginata]
MPKTKTKTINHSFLPPPPSPPTVFKCLVQSSPSRSVPMDRLELGLNKSEISRRQTIVLSKKSQSYSAMNQRGSLSGRQSMIFPPSESDV